MCWFVEKVTTVFLFSFFSINVSNLLFASDKWQTDSSVARQKRKATRFGSRQQDFVDDVNDAVVGHVIAALHLSVSGGQMAVQLALEGNPVAVQSAAPIAGEPIAAESSAAEYLYQRHK